MDKILLEKAFKTTQKIFETRYSKAQVIFLAGSIVRGEATQTSDLDLVVIFEKLPNAYRESFYFNDFPVETFVHDPETLNFFLSDEHSEACSPLKQMILEGIEIPAVNEFSKSIKFLGQSFEEKELPALTPERIEFFRYAITDMIDDIRFPRSKFELTAVGATLYEMLAEFYFRTHGLEKAKRKSIVRKLARFNPQFQKQFCQAFEDLLVNGKSEMVIELSEKLLQPYGGFLFEGYRSEAPKESRKKIN